MGGFDHPARRDGVGIQQVREGVVGKKDDEALGGAKDIQDRLDKAGLDNFNADLLDLPENVTRVQAAVALKLAGTSYTDIARVLEYSDPRYARLAVEKALAMTADSPEELAVLRVIQTKRYERLLASTWNKAVDPDDDEHLAYNARATALVDRISKLHGVDAPAKVNFTPSDEYLQTYVQRFLALAQTAGDAEEADIEDAEIVDD
jgi:hypothetical protein